MQLLSEHETSLAGLDMDMLLSLSCPRSLTRRHIKAGTYIKSLTPAADQQLLPISSVCIIATAVSYY